jgi:hypothetical protein
MVTEIEARMDVREVVLRIWGEFPHTGWPYRLPKLPSVTELTVLADMVLDTVRKISLEQIRSYVVCITFAPIL